MEIDVRRVSRGPLFNQGAKRAAVYGSGQYRFNPTWVMVVPDHGKAGQPIGATCLGALRALAARVEEEFATGRHVGLLLLG